MGACGRIGALALFCVAAMGSPAGAGAEPEHIRIKFSAPPSCPNKEDFLRALRQRTKRFQLATPGERARAFTVAISTSKTGTSGRLEVRGPATDGSVRSVAGKTCDEVMEALALMAALAVDPNVSNVPDAPSAQKAPLPTVIGADAEVAGPSSGSSPSSVTTESSEPANRPSKSAAVSDAAPIRTPAPAAAARSSVSATALPKPSTSERRNPKPTRAVAAREQAPEATTTKWLPLPPDTSSPTAPWAWAAGVHGGVSLAMSPTTGWGASLFAEAAAPGGDVWRPVLRAGLFLNRSEATLASGPSAEFRWAAVLLEACPVRIGAFDERLLIDPCLAFHIGVLRGRGRNLDVPATTTNLWADLGPVLRLGIVITDHLSLEAQGMLVLPLRRLTFDVAGEGPAQPPTTVFAVPRVGGLAGIGMAYAFR